MLTSSAYALTQSDESISTIQTVAGVILFIVIFWRVRALILLANRRRWQCLLPGHLFGFAQHLRADECPHSEAGAVGANRAPVVLFRSRVKDPTISPRVIVVAF